MSQGKSNSLICAEIAGIVALSVFYLAVGRHCELVLRIVAKFLPILLIMIVMVAARNSSSDKKIYLLPILALVFSSFGDAVGEMKGTGLGITAFALQIVFFAVAQTLYGISFLRFFSFKARKHRLIYDVLAVSVLAFFIWFGIKVMPRVDIRIAPVAVIYFILILFMALSAMMQKRDCHWTFAAGAILFFLSDSAIAYGLYVTSFPYRGLFIMSTYYAAQLLLNVSLFKPHIQNE